MVALAIVAQQMIVRNGEFDPVALAAIAFFIGLIPANRVDLKDIDELGEPESPYFAVDSGLLGREPTMIAHFVYTHKVSTLWTAICISAMVIIKLVTG